MPGSGSPPKKLKSQSEQHKSSAYPGGSDLSVPEGGTIPNSLPYYKKYRQGSESVSESLGNSSFDFEGASKKLKAENEKVKRAKGQLAKLKKEILALKKQAKIARKALENLEVL